MVMRSDKGELTLLAHLFDRRILLLGIEAQLKAGEDVGKYV